MLDGALDRTLWRVDPGPPAGPRDDPSSVRARGDRSRRRRRLGDGATRRRGRTHRSGDQPHRRHRQGRPRAAGRCGRRRRGLGCEHDRPDRDRGSTRRPTASSRRSQSTRARRRSPPETVSVWVAADATELSVRRCDGCDRSRADASLVATSCGERHARHTIRIGFYGDCHGPFTTVTRTGRREPSCRSSGEARSRTAPSHPDGVGSITIAGKRVELVARLRLLRLERQRARRGPSARRAAARRHRRDHPIRPRLRREVSIRATSPA